MKNIILIAAPGAGKGVISNYLIEKYNFIHMSTGDLIREAIKDDEEIAEIIKQGKLVDDNIVNRLVEKFMKENIDNNIIFDGYPRTMSQVKPFEEIIKKYNLKIDKLLHINIDKEIAIKRITGRLTCEKCNHIYNKFVDDVEETCKECGGKLYSRNDDNLQTYNNRYEIYKEETYPVFEFFKDKYSCYEISNNGTIEEVYDQVDHMMKEGI